ncbi:hypothetical protein M885DRAFT_508932 [Pelagophyceae sp. CCMP2097]|nr:hypothetical protein M885DRAFT_508932 [Pelagophyceae sp. CCMP2097]
MEPVPEAWEAAFEAAVRGKADRDTALLVEKKAAAERALDTFYDGLTDRKAVRQAANREQEEALQAAAAPPDAAANPFERVADLIGGSASAVDSEMVIMHALLIRLKNEPIARLA